MENRVVYCVVIALSLYSSAGMARELPGDISAFSIEAETGLVLFGHHADVVRPPAGMIKIMQMLLVAEGLERGDWTLEVPIEASRHAQRMGGTQVFFRGLLPFGAFGFSPGFAKTCLDLGLRDGHLPGQSNAQRVHFVRVADRASARGDFLAVQAPA